MQSLTIPITNAVLCRWKQCWTAVLFLFLGLTGSETVFAQNRTTISGTVRDAESGETLPYASVLAVGTTLGAATNVDGYFVLIGVPADSLMLRVTYLGYQTTLVRIDARTQNTPLIIEMTPTATELDEVLVTAESYQMMKTAENVSQVTVSPKDIAVLPNIGEVDIFRSLQLLPGISGTNEGSSGLFVRGGTPDHRPYRYHLPEGI